MVLFDVAVEVLLRLPVIDLIRCKSVCKSWYSLISSPSFIITHYKFSHKEDKNNKQHANRRFVYYLSSIQGSSNGLVCISSYDNQICLTNPSTREIRNLQKPPMLTKNVSHVDSRYGFGYDSSTDDYKLVMSINQGSDGTLVQILSLKSNVWKLFGHVNYGFHDSKPGILFNGALHWFWYNANDIYKKYIMCFDLAKEEFREIPQPEDWRYDVSIHALGIFEDSLCIFDERNDDGRPYGIWVMKKYNVKQSWELLPTDCEMKDRVHYMINDCLLSPKMPSYFTSLSSIGDDIWAPILVQTFVSPHVKDNERPSVAKNNKKIVKSACGKHILLMYIAIVKHRIHIIGLERDKSQVCNLFWKGLAEKELKKPLEMKRKGYDEDGVNSEIAIFTEACQAAYEASKPKI
ncbi:putative F-box domain containing protein [Tanacetum coccineum]